MARISDGILPGGIWHPVNNTDGTQLGLTLDRYAELCGFEIVGFNCVNKPDTLESADCELVWKQSSLDRLAMAILRAEQMREQELGFYIGPKFTTDELVNWRNPVRLEHAHLIEIGVPTLADISIGAAIDLGAEAAPNDPVTLTIASTVTPDEVRVYYPGEDVEITPSSVTSDGVTLTIRIPRARLVKPEYDVDRAEPVPYYENAYFLTTVDVERLYVEVDEATQYVWRKPVPSCPTDCSIKYQDACARIASERAYRLSTIYCEPATYSGGAWSTTGWSYSSAPDALKVTYKSGLSDLLNLTLTARLAHTLLPYSPCDCKAVSMTWEDDRTIIPGGVFTPYGNRQGAIEAWMRDSRNRIGQGGKFPRVT